MPFEENCAMDRRIRFIGLVLSAEHSMTALCEAFAISRKTGYKWLERYADFGAAGLVERSHAPKCPAHVTAPALTEEIVGLRLRHPRGPEDQRQTRRRSPRGRLALAVDGGRDLEARGARRGAPAASARSASSGRTDSSGSAQSPLGGRSQRMGAPGRRFALRAADDHRPFQPLSDQPERRFEHPRRGSQACVHEGFPRTWAARCDPLGQWAAVRLDGGDGPDRAFGMVGQIGYSSRADRSGPAATERRSRTLSPHLARGVATAERQPAGAGAAA